MWETIKEFLFLIAQVAAVGFLLTAWAALLNISNALDRIAKTLEEIEKDLKKL